MTRKERKELRETKENELVKAVVEMRVIERKSNKEIEDFFLAELAKLYPRESMLVRQSHACRILKGGLDAVLTNSKEGAKPLTSQIG